MSKATPKKKAKNAVPSAKARMNLKGPMTPTVSVRTFCEPMNFEAYFYEASFGNDGYLGSFKKVMEGNMECKYLLDANFTEIVFMRDPASDNEPLHNLSSSRSAFWRCIMIRYPPGGSTKKSREQGLKILHQFFTDKQYTSYPPRKIELVDLSSKEHPPPMDDYFLNYKVKQFMEEDIDAKELNENFYRKCSTTALFCWSRPVDYEWANALGFPSA
jgi:hypothetical protein